MQGGYVAMLDVLGFSALVRGDASGQRFQDYLACVENATKDTRVKYVVFSDTIVLTTENNGVDSLLDIARASSRIFFDLLAVRIPIRGAIAFGDFFRSTVAESVFVAGSAVIDAYQFEQQQDWVGVMLTPSARAQVADLQNRCDLNFITSADFVKRVQWAAVIQHCRSIPFHDETNPYKGFAIVPRHCTFEAADLTESINSALEQLEWLRGIAPSPASQRKYESATNWLSLIRNRWGELARARGKGGRLQS
jgi:hypothetical protein